MKYLLTIVLITCCCFYAKAQNFYLRAEGKTTAETKVIDSLSYNKVHQNAKSVADEAALLSKNLYRAGYLENHTPAYLKTNDSTFVYSYNIGAQTKSIHIYTGSLGQAEKKLLDITKDTVILNLPEVESYMNTNIALLEQKGYSITTLQLINYAKKNNTLTAALKVHIEKKRTLDNIVIEGYPKFPEGIRRNIVRQYKGRTFNRENLQRVYDDFANLRFVTQPRYPEILFKTDTTKVYVYLEKAHPNTFDGFIGFGNSDQNKVRFNGYLDLLLNNVLNAGEKFNLYWKSDGNKQTTFNVALELPYLFNTPIGAKGSLKIFKQDSTFQNTVSDINLGYYFSYNNKVYLGYQKTQSVDIQNLDSSTLSSYTNSFWTATYEYTLYNSGDFLFPQKTYVFAKAGTGSRSSGSGNSNQFFTQLSLQHNLYLNKKNIINLRNQSYYLRSDNYIINELYRFGGINSIRGFNENILQANMYTALLAEYRYVPAPNIYIHSITDYGYYQDKTSTTSGRLLSLGFGFGLLTNNGLFNLVYANGTANGQPIKFSNSIVHVSFKTSF